MSQEQGPQPRVQLHITIDFKRSYARQPAQGVLKNISLTGAFLECEGSDFKQEDKLVLTFTVSGRERKIPASVIWSNNFGAGIKFKPANNRDVQIIDDLIYFVEESRSDRRGVLNNILKNVA